MEGDPVPDIEWFVDGDKIKKGGRFDFLTDGDLVTLKISETSAEDEGEYKCTATNENGTATTTAELIVNGKKSLFSFPLTVVRSRTLRLTAKYVLTLSCPMQRKKIGASLMNNHLKRK